MTQEPYVRTARCCRLDCHNPMEATITLETKPNEPQEYALCIIHYYEVLGAVQGIKAVTNMPEVQV